MATRSDAAERDANNRRAQLRLWIDSHHGGSQADFVKTHNLNQGEISALLKGKSFGGVKARNLETQVGMPDRYLELRPNDSTESGAPIGVAALSNDTPSLGYVRLPVMIEASAGPGRVLDQEVIQHIDVLESYIRQRLHANPAKIKVLTARGNSMRGVIEDGDIMFVEPTCEFTDDGIYILTLDDLIRVKRLSVSMATGKVLIESNDGRQPEELPLKEVQHRLHIQGRVLGAWSLRSFA